MSCIAAGHSFLYSALCGGRGASKLIPVAASAADGYHHYRSPIALVIAAAEQGYLTDPGVIAFRRWDAGLPLPLTAVSTVIPRCSTVRTSCLFCSPPPGLVPR